MPMKPWDNENTRQRLVRVQNVVDDWLQEMAFEERKENRDSRAGIATQINAILTKAFRADPRNRIKLKQLK